MNFRLTVQTGISDLDLVLVFHFSPLWTHGAALQLMNSTDSILMDKVLMMTPLDLQKRFPTYHVCPKCLAALLCGSVLRKNVATSLQVLDEVGKTLVDW